MSDKGIFIFLNLDLVDRLVEELTFSKKQGTLFN